MVVGARAVDDFAAQHVVAEGGRSTRPGTLLEAQRYALLMYTSCGWFFNDLAGIETVQILRYAARSMDLYRELGEEPPVEAFLAELGPRPARTTRRRATGARSGSSRSTAPGRADALPDLAFPACCTPPTRVPRA